MANIAKKGSGTISLSNEIGGSPNPGGVMSRPAPGSDASGSAITGKGSGNITVDRTVSMPPTRAPAK